MAAPKTPTEQEIDKRNTEDIRERMREDKGREPADHKYKELEKKD